MEGIDDAVITLIASGATKTVPQTVPGGNTPYVIIPEGMKVESLEEMIWNDHAEKPYRIRQHVKVLDPASFIEYWTKFYDPNSRAFADERVSTVTGILDYHGAGDGNTPRWGSHTVTLSLQLSEEWKRWSAGNNKKFSQQEFAEFLEQNAIDITSPSPAQMMEVARDLQATTEVEFGSAIRQNDGQTRFKYTEKTNATVGGGQIAVPDQFVVTIPAYVGGVRVPLQALLRFRVNQGHLQIWYTLVRPEEVLRGAFTAARETIADALKITIINGAAA